MAFSAKRVSEASDQDRLEMLRKTSSGKTNEVQEASEKAVAMDGQMKDEYTHTYICSYSRVCRKILEEKEAS